MKQNNNLGLEKKKHRLKTLPIIYGTILRKLSIIEIAIGQMKQPMDEYKQILNWEAYAFQLYWLRKIQIILLS